MTDRLAHRIRVARGVEPCDLLLTNVQLVNVLTDEVYPVDGVAIHDGCVAGFGADREARETIDLGGRYLAPSFIDGHVHIESSMVTPREFARAVVPSGTTAVICDPHEIANVLGADGVRFMLEASEGLPLDVFVNIPSCVPATPLETAGASLDHEAIAQLLDSHPRVLGLAEMMNFPGILHADPEMLARLRVAEGRPRDGHSPQITGRDLSGYLVAGITTDHEATTAAEALDKLRQGMMLQIREGSAAKNLAELLKVVSPRSARRCMFVTDDRHPADLLEDGHINAIVRDAIRIGVSPAAACGIGAFNAAQHYRLDHPAPRGAVAPGYLADLIVFDSFDTMTPSIVFKAGRIVARDGAVVDDLPPVPASVGTDTVKVNPDALPDITVAATGTGKLRAIVAEHGSLITGGMDVDPAVADGQLVSDPSRDLLKLVVVERHTGNARTGVGFVTGFGLQHGALGSSVAHDSHNLIVVGATDDDIRHALRELATMQGGLVAVRDGGVLSRFALPIAGLMSDGPVEAARDGEHAMTAAAKQLGVTLPNPFMTLSFLALPPIPALKLTDHGLVDVTRFAVVPLQQA